MSYLNPNHFLMNLETKLKKMIDYLNIALQCKSDEEKIQFYADYPDAFYLGESDEGELSQNTFADFMGNQNFIKEEWDEFFDYKELIDSGNYYPDDKKYLKYLEKKYLVLMNNFKIYAFNICVLNRLPDDIQYIRELITEYNDPEYEQNRDKRLKPWMPIKPKLKDTTKGGEIKISKIY